MSTVNVFSAVADPTRRAMLDMLLTRPRSAGEFVSFFKRITQPGVSRHLRVLREADLVSVQIKAQQRIYSLKPDKLRELQHWISKYQRFWTERLDNLEEFLNESKSGKT